MNSKCSHLSFFIYRKKSNLDIFCFFFFDNLRFLRNIVCVDVFVEGVPLISGDLAGDENVLVIVLLEGENLNLLTIDTGD